jgi:hypothetical protein
MLKITATVSGSSRSAPSGWTLGTRTWTVTLRANGRRMRVLFHTGPALKTAPTAADVLECLALDASGYENAQDFAEWCSEYGNEPNAFARSTYRAVERQTKALRALLGDEFEAIIYGGEDAVRAACGESVRSEAS